MGRAALAALVLVLTAAATMAACPWCPGRGFGHRYGAPHVPYANRTSWGPGPLAPEPGETSGTVESVNTYDSSIVVDGQTYYLRGLYRVDGRVLPFYQVVGMIGEGANVTIRYYPAWWGNLVLELTVDGTRIVRVVGP